MADVTLDSDFFEMPVGTFKRTVSAGTGVLTYTERCGFYRLTGTRTTSVLLKM